MCTREILTWVEGCLGILPLDMVDDRAWYLLQVHSLYELMTDEQQNPTYQLGIFVYFLLVLLLHMRMIVAHWWILGLFLWVEGFLWNRLCSVRLIWFEFWKVFVLVEFWHDVKGGLISKSFYIWLKAPKKMCQILSWALSC